MPLLHPVRVVLLAAALALALMIAAPAAAACYADYKAAGAQQRQPLRLHYGVIELPQEACADPARAARIAAERLGRNGWRLLTLMSVFGDEGLAGRRGEAGANFLRY